MLLCPVPVICSKIAFLRTTLSEFPHTAPILKANSEADLWGGDPFYAGRITLYWFARPSTEPICQGAAKIGHSLERFCNTLAPDELSRVVGVAKRYCTVDLDGDTFVLAVDKQETEK